MTHKPSTMCSPLVFLTREKEPPVIPINPKSKPNINGMKIRKQDVPITSSPSWNSSSKVIAEEEEEDDDDDDEVTSSSSRDDDHHHDVNYAGVSFESVNYCGTECEEKCSWLRSQLIGEDVDIPTPFGKRHLVYADHTASGRCLHYIENFIVENVLPYYGNTHTEDSYVGHRTTKMVSEAAKYVKRCLGGGPRDALLFCGSGTTAAIKKLQEVMGIAVPSTLKSRLEKEWLKPEERWVVFVGPYEHHSNLLSWRESLADVVEINVDKEGLVDLNMLRRELKSLKYLNRPMLGSFSACSNVTGIHADTRALAQLLHEHGAFACFDFAASGPYVQIDLRSGELDGYDAVFLSPHKFVGGPDTPGILLMSKILYKLKSAPPSTCGGGIVRFVNSYSRKETIYLNDIEEREDAGTPAIIQKIRAALTFSVKEYMGYNLIEGREKMWIQSALHRLLPNRNIQVLGNTSVKRQPIISFLINTTSLDAPPEHDNGEREGYMWREGGNMMKKDKPLHSRFVTKLLNDLFGIQARGGCACAGPYAHFLLGIDREHSKALHAAIQKGYNGVKPGWTRISFAYYMSITEFEFILSAIEFVARYGQRFLPLYHFNWKTGDWNFRRSALKNVLGEEVGLALEGLELGGIWVPSGGGSGFGEGAYVNYNSHTNGSRASSQSRGINGGSTELKHKAYLETARYVAQSLPKLPPHRRLPKGVDPDLLLFWI